MVLIYHPPAQPSTIDSELYSQIVKICKNQNAVILGDLNLPKYGKPLTSHTGQDLYTNLLESSLYQLVNSPTHGNNILDLILKTKDYLVNQVVVGDEFSSSNNRSITFNINIDNVKPNESQEKYILNEIKADFHKLKNILKSTNWNFINQQTDVQNINETFSSIYNIAVESCITV